MLCSFSYDALHGVAGAYAKHIFVEELGADESSLLNCVPKVMSSSIVTKFYLKRGSVLIHHLCFCRRTLEVVILILTSPMQKSWLNGWVLESHPQMLSPPEFGAAADGDADRNMILGKRYDLFEYLTV